MWLAGRVESVRDVVVLGAKACQGLQLPRSAAQGIAWRDREGVERSCANYAVCGRVPNDDMWADGAADGDLVERIAGVIGRRGYEVPEFLPGEVDVQ
jgi:hypothetical protein